MSLETFPLCLQKCNLSLMGNERDGMRITRGYRFSRNFLCEEVSSTNLRTRTFPPGNRWRTVWKDGPSRDRSIPQQRSPQGTDFPTILCQLSARFSQTPGFRTVLCGQCTSGVQSHSATLWPHLRTVLPRGQLPS